ncbi:hypothetical protein CRU99_11305 [Malaciobacter mytili]|uniref:diguanylate cyclase n=1 Tax=Malaciobacter mytili TaxID=603050 RepID=UPI00100AB2F6|nr:diguanylate cyclase [Malaciobacter mytili]RXI38287.1 hypothetical protein CRU99_11305 [Malaciobacter mytili]
MQYIKYFDDSPITFFKYKKDYTLDYVTSNVEKLLGYSAEEFLSNKIDFESLIHKNDKEKIQEQFNCIEFEEEITLEPYRLKTKENNYIWIKETKKVFFNENNEKEICSYIQDITKEINLKQNLFYTNKIIKTVYDNSLHLIALLKSNGTILRINKTALDIIKDKEEKVLNIKFWNASWWISEEEKFQLKTEIKKATKGEIVVSEKNILDKECNILDIELTIKPVYDDNRIIYLVCEGRDITLHKLKEKKINHYNEIINKQLISITDKDGIIKDCSEGFCKLTGYSKNELIGKKHTVLKHPQTKDKLYRNLWETILSKKIWKGRHKNLTKDKKVFWVENLISPNLDQNGNLEGFTAIYNNITNSKKIKDLLVIDTLTKIYNKRYFNKIFKKFIKKFENFNKSFSLIIIDIDFFKQYNDNYGHLKGDEVLSKVARTLKETLRKNDYVFRIGGEEFAVLVTNSNENSILTVAKKLKDAIYNLNLEHKFSEFNRVTISLGIKTINEKNEEKIDKNKIFLDADNALYKAKREGRNKIF